MPIPPKFQQKGLMILSAFLILLLGSAGFSVGLRLFLLEKNPGFPGHN